MTIGNRIRKARLAKGYTQEELAQLLGYKSRSSINKLEVNGRDIPRSMIVKLATILEVTPSYLMGWDNEVSEPDVENTPIESNIGAVFTDGIRLIPLFNSVSAGFGAYACNEIVDYFPLRITSDYEAAETLCIRVKGDSMSPKIEDGDIIQVQKRSSVDSGSIAVVLLDGEEGLVKKVEYGKDWIELHSFNPYYPVRRFEGPEVLRLEVVGLVKKIIKDV